jgi:hypothetical protein
MYIQTFWLAPMGGSQQPVFGGVTRVVTHLQVVALVLEYASLPAPRIKADGGALWCQRLYPHPAVPLDKSLHGPHLNISAIQRASEVVERKKLACK